MPVSQLDRFTIAISAASIFALFFLPACTPPRPAVATDDRLAVATGQTPGFLVGSVGILTSGKTASRAVRNSLRIRSVDTGADFDVTYNILFFSFVPDDIKGDGKALNVFRLPLPPGEYEIYRVFFLDSAATWESSRNFSLPVSVEAGEEVYIGEVVAAAIPNPDWGMIDRIGYRFDFTDQRPRDFPVLQKRFPDFSPSNARTFIPARAIILAPPDLAILPVDATTPEVGAKP